LIPKAGSRGHFRGTPTLFVVRHPIDTAVSMYFQQLRCEQGIKEVGIYEFVSAYQGGLPTVIEFLNFWLEESSKIKRCKIVRYEDLSDDTFAAFRDVVRFFGFEFSDEEVGSAVDFADFGNMQKLEKSGQLSDWRFSVNAEDYVDKLKVRRGKVKGYTDYFDEEQVAALEAMVADNLNGQFGY
ncbi:MAG: sulfotransferase domain-containing protein, partial [Pseudomonadota bacterium]|nr:sulfotransferase domain-containing protein [Pseudomonadota bacterium]